MAPILPFTISIPDESLTLLHQKLQLSRLPDEPSDAGWSQGAPLSHVQRLSSYWQDGFDWRAAEAELNQMPQFTTKVEVEKFGELDVHFVHRRSKVEGAIPLLFVHGWPGSFLEVKKLLPLLTEESDEHPSFHVVAPSLPGFGFSEGPKKKGFGIKQHATILHNLMLTLGYNEYVTQAGDWGAVITRIQGHLFPSSVLASHLNFFPTVPSLSSLINHPLISLQVAYSFLTNYTESKSRLTRTSTFQRNEIAYAALASTKPQTLSYALSDSPTFLLAFLYEKLHAWTDSYPWRDDELLTWVSLYWFSRAGPGASTRLYYEAKPWNCDVAGGDVPAEMATRAFIAGPKLGLAHFPGEVAPMPRGWGRWLGEVVQEGECERGGHFAAWEAPEELVGEVRRMFGRGGPCFGIVRGRDGYEGSECS